MVYFAILVVIAQPAECGYAYSAKPNSLRVATLSATVKGNVGNNIKSDVNHAVDKELLRSTIEEFLAKELIVFNPERVAASVNDNEDYRLALEESIIRHAKKIDEQLTDAFGVQSRLFNVCSALFSLAQANDPALALVKAREIINIVNVEVLMRRELGFYLLLDESQFCDGQLIVMPCKIMERDEIVTAQGETAQVLFVNVIDTEKKVHDAFSRLSFRAKAIPGLNHFCVNYYMMLNDAKAQANIFSKMKRENKRAKAWYRGFLRIMPGQSSQLIENRVWAEMILADMFDNNLLDKDFEELYERSLRNMKYNTTLYALGKHSQQPIIDFVVNDYDATGINDVRKEIIARLIPLAFGEDIFSSEFQRILTWANITDMPRTDAIASRYILDRMAAKMNLDYSAPELAEFKYEFTVNAILHKYRDRGRSLYVKEIAKDMLFEVIDIDRLLHNEADRFHPDQAKYVQLDQNVQTLMPFVDAIVEKYATIPNDQSKRELTAYLSA
jgi:hypothetical protein